MSVKISGILFDKSSRAPEIANRMPNEIFAVAGVPHRDFMQRWYKPHTATFREAVVSNHLCIRYEQQRQHPQMKFPAVSRRGLVYSSASKLRSVRTLVRRNERTTIVSLIINHGYRSSTVFVISVACQRKNKQNPAANERELRSRVSTRRISASRKSELPRINKSLREWQPL